MSNFDKLENLIKKEIHKLRNLGEHSRKGSDHLSYRSLIKFELGKPKELIFQDKLIFEVTCKYDIYTETEFLHTPEMDEYYTEHYHDKFIFDEEFKIIEIIDIRNRE
ncbi:MAG: hypothetical protein ACFFCE_15280 [Promethearchaeota archaeon]